MCDFLKIVMFIRVKAVGKQLVDLRAAVFAGRQADTVDNDQVDAGIRRAFIAVRRGQLARLKQIFSRWV